MAKPERYGNDTISMIPSARLFKRLLSSMRNYPAHWMFFAVAGIIFLKMLVHVAYFLPAFDEAGYGDAYILFDVMSFVRTGVIYRELGQPPYLPTNYGPLLYSVLSIPYFIGMPAGFVPARVIELLSFVACVLMAASVARKLYAHRLTFPVAVVMGLSVDMFGPWLLQLRGDFPAIALELLAIRLLLNRTAASVCLAGIAAGAACGFKQSYISAIITGAIWLLARRKIRESVWFVLSTSATIAAIYGLAWLTNPNMLRHFALLSKPLLTLNDYVFTFNQFGLEPVTIIAVALICGGWWVRFPRVWLVVIYGFLSLSISAAGALQLGASRNYYYESLFAAVPLAAILFVQLLKKHVLTRRSSALLAVLLCFCVVLPRASDLYTLRKKVVLILTRSANENSLVKLSWALEGQRIVSTVPRIAILDPAPAIDEPFLGNLLEMTGNWNPEPLLKRIRQEEFNVAVVLQKPWSHRGYVIVSSKFKNSVESAYMPYCEIDAYSIFLPKNAKRSNVLMTRLTQIGCQQRNP